MPSGAETELTPLGGEPGFDETGMDEVRFSMSANAERPQGAYRR
ncbi:MAG: hypothetical protein ACLUEK_13660 [Oscillospiraceae bacterium]